MSTFDEFKKSLEKDSPPRELTAPLQALWWDGKQNWDQAHKLAQDDNSAAAAWVHAYLHRKEGNESNAGYWYRSANKPNCILPLDEEWKEIVTDLL